MGIESEFMRQPRNISVVANSRRKSVVGSSQYCQGMLGALGQCGASVSACVGKVRKQKQTSCEI